MPELKEVKLDRILPNPFRDIENYPFFRDKLDRLKDSMKNTGAWPNLIARVCPHQDAYELAFGHHRKQAIQELAEEGLLKPKVVLIIEPLSDDEMLKMMAAENAEEFGTNFALGTMNAVSAVVKAYGSGAIKLAAPAEGTPPRNLRSAPSYCLNQPGMVQHPYTADTIAEYLGWTAGDGNAQNKVITALAALELIELGVCKPQAFQGLGHKQAAAVVQQGQLVFRARMRELEKDAEEKERAKARKEAVQLAKAAVSKSVGALKDGAGVRELKEETKAIRAEVQAVATQKPKPTKDIDISRALDKAAAELAELDQKVERWIQTNEKLLGLYASGAICDGKSWRNMQGVLGKVLSRLDKFTDVMTKAIRRRG